MSGSLSNANTSATQINGETKQASAPMNIAAGVKRTDSNIRNQVVPPYLIAGFTGDRSGSMSGIDQASSKGLYKWLEEATEHSINNSQKGKIFVTTFDSDSEKVIEGVPIAEVYDKIKTGKIDIDFCYNAMKARGATKLYDTAILDLENIVNARDQLYESLPPKIRNLNPEIAMIWACCTDGFDNRSKYTRKQFREKVLWAREKGVKCFFLAANQDAQVVGSEYGFNPDTSLTFGADEERVECAMRSVTQCMREVSSGNDNYVFTQMMRQQSGPASFTPSNSPNTFNPAMMLRQAAVTGVSAFTGAASAVTGAASAAISAAFSSSSIQSPPPIPRVVNNIPAVTRG